MAWNRVKNDIPMNKSVDPPNSAIKFWNLYEAVRTRKPTRILDVLNTSFTKLPLAFMYLSFFVPFNLVTNFDKLLSQYLCLESLISTANKRSR